MGQICEIIEEQISKMGVRKHLVLSKPMKTIFFIETVSQRLILIVTIPRIYKQSSGIPYGSFCVFCLTYAYTCGESFEKENYLSLLIT